MRLIACFVFACCAMAQPVTLDQAIQEAIAKNLTIAAQKWSISVAEARQITAALRPNPVLTVGGQTLNLLGARYSPDTPLGPNQLNVRTDFPMERAHKRQERIAVAKEEKTLAELGVREIMRQVIFAVQSAFVDLQQSKRVLALAQENLRNLEGVVAINESREKSGDLSHVELERSQVAALQYRTAVQQAQLAVDQAKTQLQLLMGRAAIADPAFDIAGDMRREVLTDGPEEIGKLALARRPDLLTAKQSQARSQADLRLQIANGKVDYSVGTEYTHQRAWGVGGSSVGLYFSMPLPVFNKNQGEIARAQREISQGGATAAAIEASIKGEVDKAYRQYSVFRQMVSNIETNMVSRAKSVRDITEYSYRRGEASLVEFLDAQRAFNDSMQALHEAEANFARSLYLLDSVSGASVSGN